MSPGAAAAIAMRKRSPGWRSPPGTGCFTLMAVTLVVMVLFKVQALLHLAPPPPPGIPPARSPQRKTSTTSKLAFLFLARHQMPLDFLWEHFFQGSRAHEYSVYIHARPGFVYTKDNTRCSSFVDRQLQNSVLVEWGEASMIQAERLLLAAALRDPLNQRFMLLSDSCIPLYNFRYIYDYVMHSQKSFVDSFVDAHDTRYNPKMAPVIWKKKWRKGSQWFVLIRRHAVAVVEDATIFPVFQRFCKRLALPEFWGEFTQNRSKDGHNCIPDEHYLQTLLAMRGLEPEVERRAVTYSQWRSSQKSTMDRRGWHPITFDYAKTTLKAIKDIQDIRKLPRGAAEGRPESCGGLGSQALPCFLFARKFTRGAGLRLLQQVAAYENRVLPLPHARGEAAT